MTSMDDVTQVARELEPELPYDHGQLAMAAVSLLPVARDLEHLTDLVRKAAEMAQAQGMSLGETALTIACGTEAMRQDDQIKALVAAGYQAIAAAGAIGASDGVVDIQRTFIVAGILAAEKAAELLTPDATVWATAVEMLAGDLRLFAATLKAESGAADKGSRLH